MILLQLFWTFFKVGACTFGGGYAMIPMIESEMLAHQWISMEQMVDFIAISESTPGPFAVNIATFVGMETSGFLGAAVATLGVVLPSFLIILLIAHFFLQSFQKNRVVNGALQGVRPAVIGLMASVTVTIGYQQLFPLGVQVASSWHGLDIRALLIMVLLLGLRAWKKELHPIWVIGISAVLGVLFYGVWGV